MFALSRNSKQRQHQQTQHGMAQRNEAPTQPTYAMDEEKASSRKPRFLTIDKFTQRCEDVTLGRLF